MERDDLNETEADGLPPPHIVNFLRQRSEERALLALEKKELDDFCTRRNEEFMDVESGHNYGITFRK